MTTEKRRGKLELDLKAAEVEFTAELVAALKKCAAGQWGLFGRNGERWDRGGSLLERGEAIHKLRKQLGYTEEFDLYERFVTYRHRRSSNDPGEPNSPHLSILGFDLLESSQIARFHSTVLIAPQSDPSEPAINVVAAQTLCAHPLKTQIPHLPCSFRGCTSAAESSAFVERSY